MHWAIEKDQPGSPLNVSSQRLERILLEPYVLCWWPLAFLVLPGSLQSKQPCHLLIWSLRLTHILQGSLRSNLYGWPTCRGGHKSQLSSRCRVTKEVNQKYSIGQISCRLNSQNQLGRLCVFWNIQKDNECTQKENPLELCKLWTLETSTQE